MDTSRERTWKGGYDTDISPDRVDVNFACINQAHFSSPLTPMPSLYIDNAQICYVSEEQLQNALTLY